MIHADDGRPPRDVRRLNRVPDPHMGADGIVELEIAVTTPSAQIRTDAVKEGISLVRQAMRAVGESIEADAGALHDAELTLTEACSNAVRHAYPGGDGTLVASIDVRDGAFHTLVRDAGRGMETVPPPPSRQGGGLGLKVIDALVDDVEIRSERGLGTEIAMALPTAPDLRGGVTPAWDGIAIGQIVRRVVGLATAQADFPPERITEALIAMEIVAGAVPRNLVGETVRLRLAEDQVGIQMFIGPLSPGGARRILEGTGVLGVIVRRLADAVWEMPPDTGRPSDGEELALRFAA